jgi:hypothetical protein
MGAAGAIALGILAVLVLPMALLTLGWTSESSAALDPRAWWHFSRALGSSFIYLEIIGAVVVAGSAALLSGAIHLNLILRIAVAMSGWLLLVALAGATVHARRNELAAVTEFYRGIELPVTPADIARERQQFIDDIYSQWRGGAQVDAWNGIVRRATAATSPADEYRWIYEDVAAWDAAPLATRIARELVPRDLRAGRTGYALRMTRERLAAGKFSLPAASDTLALAQLAAEHADRATALALLAAFDEQDSEPGLMDAARELRNWLDAGRVGRRSRAGLSN